MQDNGLCHNMKGVYKYIYMCIHIHIHITGPCFEYVEGPGLKHDINEIKSKICYDIVKYIKPKEFIFFGKEEREIGFTAQDIPNSKMPTHDQKW